MIASVDSQRWLPGLIVSGGLEHDGGRDVLGYANNLIKWAIAMDSAGGDSVCFVLHWNSFIWVHCFSKIIDCDDEMTWLSGKRGDELMIETIKLNFIDVVWLCDENSCKSEFVGSTVDENYALGSYGAVLNMVTYWPSLQVNCSEVKRCFNPVMHRSLKAE